MINIVILHIFIWKKIMKLIRFFSFKILINGKICKRLLLNSKISIYLICFKIKLSRTEQFIYLKNQVCPLFHIYWGTSLSLSLFWLFRCNNGLFQAEKPRMVYDFLDRKPIFRVITYHSFKKILELLYHRMIYYL